MPNYNYKKDKKISNATEKEVSEKLKSYYGTKTIYFNNNKDFDLSLVTKRGKKLLVEIKEDFLCEKTGNVGLEFSCRGKPSGISSSKSTHYIYKIHSKKGIVFYVIDTKILKRAIENKKYFRIVNGGDKGSNSLNYLFKFKVFTDMAEKLF